MSAYTDRINALIKSHETPGEAVLKTLAEPPKDKLSDAGNLLAYMVPEMAVGKLLSMLPKVGQYLNRGSLAGGALSNAAAGAIHDAGYGEDPVKGAVTSGLVGAGLTGVGKVLQRAVGGPVKPLINEDAKTLLSQGVVPTVGQATRGNSYMGYSPTNVEDALTFFPMVGSIPLKGRARADTEAMAKALEDFGIVSNVPGSLGPKAGPPKTGDWMKAVDAETNRQYREILGSAPSTTVSSTMAQEVGDLFGRSRNLTNAMLLNADGTPSVLQKLMVPGTNLDGEEIHRALSTIKSAMPSIDNANASTLHQARILERLKSVVSQAAENSWGPGLWDEYKLQNFNNVNTEALRRSTVDAVKRGEDSPNIRDFYRELISKTNDKVLSHDANISSQLLRPAVNTMTENPSWSDRQNIYRIASLLAPGASFATGHPLIAGALLAPAIASGSRATTRYMLGDYPAQNAAEEALKRITPSMASLYSAYLVNGD